MRTVLILALCSSALSWGQVITGAITGSVRDASDAAMVGISVKLTNVDTGGTNEAISDATGRFQFLLLPPGRYEVQASSGGFKTFRRTGIVVETARSLDVPV